MTKLANLLLIASVASAALYDPGANSEALRSGALAAHESVSRACGLALEPSKAASIKDSLDEGTRRVRGAADAATHLDASARRRTAEMAAALKKSETKSETSAERPRWLKASRDHAGLSERVEKLPGRNPDGKPGPDKRRLQEAMRRAAASLKTAADALRRGEDAVTAMAEALQKMKDAARRAQSSAAELEAEVAEALRLAALLPTAADKAKAGVDLLEQEPRNVSRTRAWDKLEAARGLASALFTAADAACNRSSELHDRSDAFARAQDAFEKSRSASGAAPAEARPALDEAEKTLAEVRERLGPS